jgi:cation diffusion facilitator CzcD-associated flavoprotein CzcO
VHKYSLSQHIELYSEIISAEWDSVDQLYHLSIQDVHLGAKRSTTAQVVISAVGYLDVPGYPSDIPGISTFKGHLFHSARWNHSVDFKNKKVAVIGNGAST